MSGVTSSLVPLTVQVTQIHEKAEGGGEKRFGNRSQDGAQLHNCTKEKGYFGLVWFSFSYLSVNWKNVVGKLSGKTSASFGPVGTWSVLEWSTCFMAVAFSLSGLTSTGRCQKTLHSQPTQGLLVSSSSFWRPCIPLVQNERPFGFSVSREFL